MRVRVCAQAGGTRDTMEYLCMLGCPHDTHRRAKACARAHADACERVRTRITRVKCVMMCSQAEEEAAAKKAAEEAAAAAAAAKKKVRVSLHGMCMHLYFESRARVLIYRLLYYCNHRRRRRQRQRRRRRRPRQKRRRRRPLLLLQRRRCLRARVSCRVWQGACTHTSSSGQYRVHPRRKLSSVTHEEY